MTHFIVFCLGLMLGVVGHMQIAAEEVHRADMQKAIQPPCVSAPTTYFARSK